MLHQANMPSLQYLFCSLLVMVHSVLAFQNDHWQRHPAGKQLLWTNCGESCALHMHALLLILNTLLFEIQELQIIQARCTPLS